VGLFTLGCGGYFSDIFQHRLLGIGKGIHIPDLRALGLLHIFLGFFSLLGNCSSGIFAAANFRNDELRAEQVYEQRRNEGILNNMQD